MLNKGNSIQHIYRGRLVEKAVQKTKNVIVRNDFEGLISRWNRICRWCFQ
jgi:hypothetical protein